MELKWLDDYLALIETGTFSAAAEKRHISQPAFSRRIQLLEKWLGVDLIDRSRKPLRFTPLANRQEAAFRILATRIYEFQAALKSDATHSPGLVMVAQHSLAASYLPTFLEELRALMPEQRFRIRSENRDEGVTLLMRGQADILLAYESPQSASGVPSQLATSCVLVKMCWCSWPAPSCVRRRISWRLVAHSHCCAFRPRASLGKLCLSMPCLNSCAIAWWQCSASVSSVWDCAKWH